MEVQAVAAASEAIFEVLGCSAYWVAFVQFVLMRPALQMMPTFLLGSALLNLVVAAIVTMAVITLLLAVPLFIFGYFPLPRDPEFRHAYFWGLISGGLSTHVLWGILIKFFGIQARSHK